MTPSRVAADTAYWTDVSSIALVSVMPSQMKTPVTIAWTTCTRMKVDRPRSTMRRIANASGRSPGEKADARVRLISRSLTIVSTHTGITSSPNTKLAVSKMPRIWLVMKSAAPSANPRIAACRLAATSVTTVRTIVRTGSGRSPSCAWNDASCVLDRVAASGRFVATVRQPARSGGKTDDDDEHDDRDRDELRDDRGEHPWHDAVEPVRDRQHRVGEHRPEHEREQRRPGAGGDPDAQEERPRRQRESADRLGRDGGRPGTERSPLALCSAALLVAGE